MVYINKGRYTVAGNRIRLMPTALQQHVCGSPQVTTRPGDLAPADYRWRMQYYAGQSLSFELIAASKLRDARDWYYATQYVATAP